MFIVVHRFPKFWTELQQELDVHEEDLKQIKSIFTALDYRTSSSIAAIKNMKNLKSLEIEFNIMRTNSAIFDEKCSKFPALKEIHSFSSGMKATMMSVIKHLIWKKPAIILDNAAKEVMFKTSKESVNSLARKV